MQKTIRGALFGMCSPPVDILRQIDLYRAVVAALGAADSQAAMPVDPWDAVHTLAVLDAARVSAAEERVVTVRTPAR